MRAARVHSSLAVISALLLASGAASTCLAQAVAAASGRAHETRVLTNADVVQMLKSGFSDSAVIAVIQKATTQFDLSSASLAELRYAGVSDSVVVAMLESGNRAPGAASPPATAAPAPATAAPAPAAPTSEPGAAPVVTPEPAVPPEPRPLAPPRELSSRARRGGIFGLSLGGHYAWVIDEGLGESSGETENRFGAALGLLAGGHLGRRVALLADLHASLWPETDEFEAAALVSLGPAVRVFPVSHLFLQGGVSFALAVQNNPDDPYGDDPQTWLGPAGHLGVGVELTSGRGRFALELLARLDLAYLSQTDCEGCDAATLGRATGQLAFTWY